MRKIFAGAMIFSVIGAVILGGALAWTSTVTLKNQSVDVGSLTFDISYSQSTDALLGPDGETNTVGFIAIQNTGDFNLELDSSLNGARIIVTNVDAGHASCDTTNFTGGVQDLGQGILPANSTGFTEDVARVVMTVKLGAPNACIGATVTYDILIVLHTTGN